MNSNAIFERDFLHGHLFLKVAPSVAFSRLDTLSLCLEGGLTSEATLLSLKKKKKLINILSSYTPPPLVSCLVEMD